MISVFIDGLLSWTNSLVKVLRQYGSRHMRYGKMVYQYYIRQRTKALLIFFGFCWISVQAAEHTDAVNELSIAQDDDRKNAWHLAALGSNIQ